MARVPEAQTTPAGPAFEGRLLDHPDEPVVDQGAAFDLRTLISRRGVLSLVGLGIGAATLAACATDSASATGTAAAGSTTTSGTGSTSSTEIPQETAGPYPGDGSNGPDVLEESGIVRSDIRTSLDGGTTADGVPLTFTFTVTDLANGGAAFAGLAVYAWHCDALGRYSMYSEGVEDETYLRGVQVTDDDGRVTFTSIVPAAYDGRWPHIHFEVYPDVDSITDSANAIATSQMAFPADLVTPVYALAGYDGSAANFAKVTLATDGVFGDDSAATQLPTWSGDTTTGYVTSLVVPVDTRTAATAGTVSGGGGGGAPGGSGAGGPGSRS